MSQISLDVFGIKKMYQDKVGGPQWDARHWNNGVARTLTSGCKDTYDPTKCSENRGNVNWTIDGKGSLIFNGTCSGTSEPRFHLNNPSSYFFRDCECTMYMMRVSDNNTNWAGPNCGVRSGPNGHSISSEYCDAHTYYQRIRYDGTADFEKELKHPDSSTRNLGNVWSGAKFPFNKWIGYKSVTYNTPTGVHMELYRDLTGGVNGGTWVKLGSTDDIGGWAPPQASPVCSYAKDYIPMQGGGVIVMRNTGVTNATYKWMTVREIIPTIANESEESETLNESDHFVYLENDKCTTEPVVEYAECESGMCQLNTDESNNDTNNQPSWFDWISSYFI